MSDRIAAFLERPPVGAYVEAYRVLNNVEDARDAVAEAVRLAWEHAGEYRGDASIATWFAVIVRNVASMERRRRTKTLRRSDEVVRRIPAVRNPEWQAIKDEQERRMKRAVGHLPQPYRDAVRLRYYEGMTQEASARLLGISDAACKSRLHRARRILEERLYGTAKRKSQTAVIGAGEVYD